MKVTLQYVINERNGTPPELNFIRTGMEDPVFLNMEFCIERDHYNKIKEICNEYKVSIHEALWDILRNENPNTLIDQYGP